MLSKTVDHFDETFDVIVVGYGFGGAVAALSAHDAGADVLLAEKMPNPGGISICSGGGLRLPYDRDATFQYLKSTNDGTTPDNILEAFTDEMVQIDAYVQELAAVNGAHINRIDRPGSYAFPGFDKMYFLEIDDIPNFDPKRDYAYANALSGGPFMFKVLQDNIAKRGIKARFGISAKRLITDKSGAVSGVWLDDGNGPKAVGARKAVILACGGFEHAPEMQRQYWQINPVFSAAFVGNTGDGIRMTTDLGADLWHMWHFHGTYGFRHPDLPFAIRTKRLPDWVPDEREAEAPMSWILVGKNGRRFMNEYDPYMQDTGHRGMDRVDPSQMGQPFVPCYMILDDDARQLYPLGQTMFNDGDFENYEWSQDNLKEVQNGLIRKADSVEELAEMIGCPVNELGSTIENWNESCDAGADDFGRPPKSMVPVRQAPFYLAEIWPVVSNTQGGPVHDEKRRVVNAYGEPIPRLYTAGELGGIWGSLYLSGGNLTECFVSGRISGREAAAEVNRPA
tara:strand:- start:29 stop:1555 length:1527 start_codon:yes stop_codon:yes gene_type:complete